MRLEKYIDKSKKKRKIILISISVSVLISVSLLLYKTFASFTESVEFSIMNGKVDYFGNSDVYFVFYKGNELIDTMPTKDNNEGLSFVKGECDNEASIVWNEEAWGPMVKNLSKSKTKCSLYFDKMKYYVSTSASDGGNGNKETPLKTIKEAYEKIENKGTIVLLNDVTENEGIIFNSEGKEITITSEGTHEIKRGNSLTTKPIIEISNNNKVTLANITINGLEIEATKSLINVIDSSITINEGTIIENGINNNGDNGKGGGLYLQNSSIVINGGIIKNNQSSRDGGGFTLITGNVEINGGQIIENKSMYGAGMEITNKVNFTMNGGSVSNNNASYYGGGMHLNSNNYDGAIYIFNGGDVSNNTSTERGGGIKYNPASGAATIELKGTNFIGNTSDKWSGGIDIENRKPLKFELSGGTISNNVAKNNTGGGIILSASSDNNVYNLTGGKIINNQAYYCGGGLRFYFDASNNILNISNTIFSGNSSIDGGAIAIDASKSTFTNNVVNFKSGEISNNTVTNNGGGIYMTNFQDFNMTGGSIINNKSTNDQGTGGIYAYNNVKNYNKTGGTISDNTPTDVGGIATK